MALITGRANKISNPIMIAVYWLSILRVDAPRYANTNASHM